ncbi:MAG: CDP-alcohol phosphatidyltransferase family protein [Actinobacteria bacterium]|nr:CDP-alcohol phosphatidyltransferase family protein [Actinomycetota bacterium]
MIRVRGRGLTAILDRLRDPADPVVLVAADLVIAEAALAPLASDPFVSTSILVRHDPRGNLRVRHHRVVSAGSSVHRVSAPTHVGVGALVISTTDASAAVSALMDLDALLSHGALAVEEDELLELCVVALVRAGIGVQAIELVDVPWFRGPTDREAAQREVATVGNQRIAQLQANRVDDGFYSTFLVRRVSKPATRLALRIGLAPNTITVISFIFGVLAALAFAQGTRAWLVAGAIALQLSLVVDCVDGEVARATRRFSALGAWLDASTDRVKEYAAYAGLATGAVIGGLPAWWVAVVLVVLQTVRHMGDYTFSRIQRLREAHVAPRPLTDLDDGTSHTGGFVEVSTRMNRRAAVRWVKKVVHMPIGERWLVLSIGAMFFNGYVALLALLVLVAIAFLYTALGRIARTFTWSGLTPTAGVTLVRSQLDDGPVGAAVAALLRLRLPAGRWVWIWPSLICLIELGLVAAIVLGSAYELLPLAFGYLFIVAYHHYDTLYRALQGSRPPRWLDWLAFGWEGRTILVLVAVGIGVLDLELRAASIWLLPVCVILASVQWLRSVRRMS